MPIPVKMVAVYAEEIDWLKALKPGDLVHRWWGEVPLTLTVTRVTPDRIECGGEEGWTFDRATGAEIDDTLGWGPKGTGSWIKPISN